MNVPEMTIGGEKPVDTTELDNLRMENDELFDRLPASESGTIRPALVSEGKLLKKGLAAAKMP